jgi:hypothetical protein
VLPDGRLLLAASGAMEPPPNSETVDFVAGMATAIFDPKTQTWSNYAYNPGSNWEATWTLLADGTVLCPSSANPPTAYKYAPANDGTGGGGWVSAGSTPEWASANGTTKYIAFDWGAEIGPALLLLDGNVIAFGATGHNAIYNPVTGNWTQGAEFSDPNSPGDGNQCASYTMADAPAVLLPSGNALCIAGPYLNTGGGHSGPPALAFEFVPTRLPPPRLPPPGGPLSRWLHRPMRCAPLEKRWWLLRPIAS